MVTRAREALAGPQARSNLAMAAAAIVLAALTGVATAKLGSFQHQLKALIIVGAGVAMVVAAFRPDIGLLILIALCPFEFAFYGTNSNQALLVLLAIVLAWRIRANAVPWWAGTGAGAIVIGSFIATLGAHNKSIALEGAIDWLCATVILLVAFTEFQQRPAASRRMVEVIVGMSVIVVLFGFLQKAGVHAIVGAPFNVGRPNSFFSYYTVYAGYLALAATLATAEILIAFERRRTARVLSFGAVLILLLAGLTASTSRGGLVALGVGWVVLLAFNVNRASVIARAVVVLAVVAAAGYLATPHSTLVTIEHRFAQSNGSLGEDKTRFAVQHAGKVALEHRPLGLGYGNFPYYLSSYVRNANVHQPFFHAQETFYEMGLDAGWLGLAGFLLLVFSPIVMVVKHGRGGTSAIRASAMAACIAGFLAQGLYDFVLWDLPFVILLMAMVWGTAHSLGEDRSSGERARSPATRARSQPVLSAPHPFSG